MLVVSSFLTYFSILSEIFKLTHCSLISFAALWTLLQQLWHDWHESMRHTASYISSFLCGQSSLCLRQQGTYQLPRSLFQALLCVWKFSLGFSYVLTYTWRVFWLDPDCSGTTFILLGLSDLPECQNTSDLHHTPCPGPRRYRITTLRIMVAGPAFPLGWCSVGIRGQALRLDQNWSILCNSHS